MNRVYFLVVFLFFTSFIHSCGNPTVEELESMATGVGGNTPIEPPGDDDNGGGDDDDGGTPGARRIIVEVTGYAITQGDLKNLKLPYKSKTVKPVPMGTITKTSNCPKKHKDHCSENRQVLVAFDLNDVTKYLDDYYVSDIQISGDFYSVGKNYRTELLCLLHKRACSGRGIIKFPGWGLPWIAKMVWWEKSFWKEGYDKIVKTGNFHNELEAAWNETEGLYMMEGATLKFNRLFGYNTDDLTSITKDQDRFVLTVTDDTFLKNAKLTFKLVEDL